MKDKTETLIIRIADFNKEKLFTAANKQGVSITEFVTRATLAKADAVLLKAKKQELDNKRPTHHGVPRFFQGLCQTASQGGAQSYKWVGYTFGGATANEMPFDADSDQWENMLQEVQNYIESNNEEKIWLWYKQTYPEAMALIPAKRKESFVKGILEAYNAGELWFM